MLFRAKRTQRHYRPGNSHSDGITMLIVVLTIAALFGGLIASYHWYAR